MIVTENVTVVDIGDIDSAYVTTLFRFLSVNNYKYSTFVNTRHTSKMTRRLVLGIEEGSIKDLLNWLATLGIKQNSKAKV